MRRKGVLASRTCSSLPRLSYLLTLLLLGMLYKPKMWRPGSETQQSAIFVVRSGTAGTNPTDSTFNFDSL